MDEDTLVEDIVTQAFREGNFTAVGEGVPAEELSEGVARLRNLINAVFGFELGDLLRDWYVPQETNPEAPLRRPLTPQGTDGGRELNYRSPPSNSRLLVNVTTPHTIYFPAHPSDGAQMAFVTVGTPDTVDVTLDANGRLIEGAASITSDADADPTPVTFHGRKWLYRADRGEWVRLTQIVSDGRVPTPPEFDALWITGLAIAMAPRYQIEIQSTVRAMYVDMLGRLRKRYRQKEGVPGPYEGRMFSSSYGIVPSDHGL